MIDVKIHVVFGASSGGAPSGGAGSAALDAKIAAALASPYPGTRLEGEVALAVRADLVAFQQDIGLHGQVTEIDIETTVAIIEVTLRPKGRLRDVQDRLTDARLNPLRKAVILYAPRYGKYATQDVQRAGAYVVHDLAALRALHHQLGGS